jgi:cobalamin biosynthesis Mg chelatase CobN
MSGEAGTAFSAPPLDGVTSITETVSASGPIVFTGPVADDPSAWLGGFTPVDSGGTMDVAASGGTPVLDGKSTVTTTTTPPLDGKTSISETVESKKLDGKSDITATKTPVSEEATKAATEAATAAAKKKTTMWIVIGVLAATILGGAIWYFKTRGAK